MEFWQLLAHPRVVTVGWSWGQLSLLWGTSAFHSVQTPPAHETPSVCFLWATVCSLGLVGRSSDAGYGLLWLGKLLALLDCQGLANPAHLVLWHLVGNSDHIRVEWALEATAGL